MVLIMPRPKRNVVLKKLVSSLNATAKKKEKLKAEKVKRMEEETVWAEIYSLLIKNK